MVRNGKHDSFDAESILSVLKKYGLFFSCTLGDLSFFLFSLFFSRGLVRLYIAGLPLRSCRIIGAPSVQGSAQCAFFRFWLQQDSNPRPGAFLAEVLPYPSIFFLWHYSFNWSFTYKFIIKPLFMPHTLNKTCCLALRSHCYLIISEYPRFPPPPIRFPPPPIRFPPPPIRFPPPPIRFPPPPTPSPHLQRGGGERGKIICSVLPPAANVSQP